MAVSTLEPLLKSAPDASKINSFTGCIVTVTKHQNARNTPGVSVVATQTMSKEQVYGLQVELPLKHGPGYYRFDVVDAGGSGEDKWMVKLGPDQPQEFSPMPGQQGPTLPPAGLPPTGEGVVHLGHGFFYNPVMHTLTTPWRKIYNWNEGDPFPEQPPAAAAHLQAVPANATPWNWPPQQGGWGGYPVQDDSTKRLEAQLAEERRQRAEETLRHEMRAQAEATERRMEQQQQRFEALIKEITAKPTGPSPEQLRLERQLEDEKHRREEAEREARRREEEQRREERHRIELQAINDKFERLMRDAAPKTDPMMPMLMQMFTQQQAGAMEAVKSIQSAMSTASLASERQTQQMLQQLSSSVMSPMQIAQLMQQSQGAGAEGARVLVSAMREAMDTQKVVFQQLLDVAGEGNQPAWVSVASQALEKASVIGTALAERSERMAQQPVVQQRPVYVQRPMPATANGVARTAGGGIPQPAMTTGAPAIAPQPPQQDANDTGVRPPGTEFDAAKNEFVLSNGQRISHADVTRDGWRRSLAELQKRAAHTFPPAPLPETPAVAPPVVVAPAVVSFPPAATAPVQFNGAPVEVAPAPAPKAKGKRGKTKGTEPVVYTVRDIGDRDPAEVREAIAPWSDDILFGPYLLPYVQQLRATDPLLDPADVAKAVIEARVKLGAAGQTPPALELFDAKQFEVLAYRLFPGVDEQYLISVVEALEEATGTTDEDEEEDESDE